MKTIIKFALFTVLSFTGVVALLFWDDFKLFADTGKRLIEEKFEEAQGMQTKLSLMETKIEGLDREIYGLKAEVLKRKVDAEYLDRILGEKEQSLAELEDALEQAGRLLEEKHDYYVIGGKRYTHSEVARDASEKMKLYSIQEETVNNLRTTLETKRSTLQLAEANVDKGLRLRDELRAKCQYLGANLERYQAKEVYAETVQAADPGVEFKTLLGQAQQMLNEFEKQLEVKDRLLDERIRLGGEYLGGIDYNGPSDVEPEDVVERIKVRFGTGGIAMDP